MNKPPHQPAEMVAMQMRDEDRVDPESGRAPARSNPMIVVTPQSIRKRPFTGVHVEAGLQPPTHAERIPRPDDRQLHPLRSSPAGGMAITKPGTPPHVSLLPGEQPRVVEAFTLGLRIDPMPPVETSRPSDPAPGDTRPALEVPGPARIFEAGTDRYSTLPVATVFFYGDQAAV